MKSRKNPLRLVRPQRTCTKTYKSYRSFKSPLKVDFNSRCGYCDDPDSWDGYRHYHIDHFVPKTKLNNIGENEYKNLVYSCFWCNNSKDEDWPSGDEMIHVSQDKGYIDPCEVDYDKQFHREYLGDIVPKTKVGRYMFDKMKLGLKRHAIIWMLSKLDSQIQSLLAEKAKSSLSSIRKRKVGAHIKELQGYYYEYTGALKNENNQ